MIKSIIFDYGNVISEVQTGDCANEMELMTGVPAAVFRSVYDRFRFDFDRGLITGAEMYARLLDSEGYHSLALDMDLMKKISLLDVQSWRKFRQDVTDWGLSLQKQGFKLGILSNMPTEFLQYYRNEIPLFVHADYACFSCEVHVIKPEPEIYNIVLDGLGVRPEEAVFYDDMQVNIDAACNLGIHACLWTGLENARNALDNFIRCFGNV